MILRGSKLQTAIQLFAEQILTEGDIAVRLGISLRIMEKLRREPVFVRRVRQVRATLANARPAESQLESARGGAPRYV